MQYRELRTKDEIFSVIKDHFYEADLTKAPPLFHGTDESLIEMTQEEREVINKACETVMFSVLDQINKHPDVHLDGEWHSMDYKSTLFKAFMQSHDDHGYSIDAYNFALRRRLKVSTYQYGDFYVTDFPERAIGYSREAWIYGETGWVANRLVEGAKEAGIDLPADPEFIEAYKVFERRKQRSKSRVVLVITDCDTSRLSTEGDAILNKRKLYSLKTAGVGHSYRLSFPWQDTDGIYMVKEEYYEELEKAWDSYLNS